MLYRFVYSSKSFSVWAALVSASLLSVSVVGDHVAVYRVAAENATDISAISHSGVLSISSAATTGAYLIERSVDIGDGGWHPFTRGAFSNQVWSVKVRDPAPPPGMVFVPGGQFTMGDVLRELSNARDVHQAIVSPFFMHRFEVTNQELCDVYQWAYDEGLVRVDPNTTGSGTASDFVILNNGTTNVLLELGRFAEEVEFEDGTYTVRPGRGMHPCAYITWFGAVAYCNFLSAMEDRDLCYDLTQWTCDFTMKGYRLPTEAEWEIAARSGYEGYRFPWGDTNVITHSRANYRSSTNNWYDVSPTLDFHPDYANVRPRSSPVGTFAPNNFGLYDLSGNVWEWVWDWGARFPAETQYDPTGPDTGAYRVFRGGSWYTTAERVTCASRYTTARPYRAIEDVGFRVVLR